MFNGYLRVVLSRKLRQPVLELVGNYKESYDVPEN